MKNTLQGATACIQPSRTLQSSMLKDPSLPGKDISHQPTKLEQSILCSEYVNFIDLLKPHKEHVAHGEDAVVVDQEGNLTLQKSRSQCAIDSFSTWLSAWSEYEQIIVLANPHRYGKMAKIIALFTKQIENLSGQRSTPTISVFGRNPLE